MIRVDEKAMNVLEDRNLSFAAKGVYMFLWESSDAEIVEDDEWNAAIAELESKGYITIKRDAIDRLVKIELA